MSGEDINTVFSGRHGCSGKMVLCREPA